MNAPVLSTHFTDPGVADTLADEITLLAGQINAGQHRLLQLIAEFDHSKQWCGGGTGEGEGGPSP